MKRNLLRYLKNVGSFVCCPEHATKVNTQINIHNAIIIFFIISSSKFRFLFYLLPDKYEFITVLLLLPESHKTLGMYLVLPL